MVCVCSLSSSQSFLGEERALRVEEKENGKGEGRLLHMSVAMGILAQWLCSNVAAGIEDLFSQGRLGGKKRGEHELELHSPIMWREIYLKKEEKKVKSEVLRLYLGAASETFDVFILPHRPD